MHENVTYVPGHASNTRKNLGVDPHQRNSLQLFDDCESMILQEGQSSQLPCFGRHESNVLSRILSDAIQSTKGPEAGDGRI